MATKRKSNSPARRPKGRGRRALILLVSLAALVAAVLALAALGRPKPELAVAVQAAAKAGGPGAGALDGPRGLAVGADGEVYVADLGHSRIAVYGPDGAYRRSLGKPAGKVAKPGELAEPSGVAVGADGSIFIADSKNGRVLKWDAKGKQLAEWGGATYGLYYPRNLVLDKAGNLYVADTGTSHLKVLDPSGKILKVVGGKGSGAGQFDELFGLALDSKGNVYVADVGNGRIQKFSPLPALEFVAQRKVPGWQAARPFWPMLACGADDVIYASDSNGRKIWAYDSGLKYRASLGLNQDLFNAPLGLAFSPEGQLWVSDQPANLLLKLAAFSLPAQGQGK